jgi:diguanylate cyclase (GGDEF)-like protein
MRIPRTNALAVNITTVVLLSTSIALVIFAATLMVLDHMSSIGQLDNQLSTLADVMGQNSSAALNFTDEKVATEVLQALQAEPQIVSACLYDVQDSLFAEYQRDENGRRCSLHRDGAARQDGNLRSVARPVYRRAERLGMLYISSDLRSLSDRERRLLLTAATLAIVALLLGGVAGSFFQLRISKPIESLASAMRSVTTEGRLDARVKVAGSNEIAELAIGFNSMLAELERRDEMTKRAEAKLLEQARTDALTGLPNRRYFTEHLGQDLALARRLGTCIGLLYIDLDGFKLVNDSLGHAVGDLLLCDVAERLGSRIRQSDTLARVGGDEFTVILTALKKPEDAARAAEGLIEVLSRPFLIETHEITIGASIGISIHMDAVNDGVDLLRQADSAMYAAKRSGRNQFKFFSPELGLMARERLALENQLRGAIARREIYVHYQPEFDTRTGRLVRFEALARWKHPQVGQIPPDRFIPVAEDSGLIHPLGEFIMDEACREAAKWQLITPYPVQVAVNVSAIQFNAEGAVEAVAASLERTGLRPELLQIELTESVMVGPLKLSADKMKRLRSLGVHLAIDDFGTGYSSLSYLSDLPVQAIKIDRSFVRNLESGPESTSMMHSMIAMAQSMKMRVIVEGIETGSQLELVRDLGADEVQGFYLGRPAEDPLGQLKDFLRGAERQVTLAN